VSDHEIWPLWWPALPGGASAFVRRHCTAPNHHLPWCGRSYIRAGEL